MIKSNQTWDQSSEEVPGSVFFNLLIAGNLPVLLMHASMKPERMSLHCRHSVGHEATDGKNNVFDQGWLILPDSQKNTEIVKKKRPKLVNFWGI